MVELGAMTNLARGVRAKTVGFSRERRPIVAVRFGPTITGEAVPSVNVIGGYHSNEWASHAVSIRLARWAHRALVPTSPYTDEPVDAELQELLKDRALVVMPVANPDGYAYTRSTDREWRWTRGAFACPPFGTIFGVDMNRNHRVAWDSFSDRRSELCTATDWRGPAPSSEPETIAAETIMQGIAFVDATDSDPFVSAATVSYHSSGNYVLFPNGYKDITDANGPSCTPNGNCLNPDYPVLREIFGDAEKKFVFDLEPSEPVPYTVGQNNNVLYTTQGTSTQYGNFQSPNEHLSVTVELTSGAYGHMVNCAPRASAIVDGMVFEQKRLVKRLLREARALTHADTTASAFAVSKFGRIGPGFFVREASNGLTTTTARPRFLQGRFVGTDAGPFTASADGGAPVALAKARLGGQYQLYFAEVSALTGSPLRIPCTTVVTERQGSNPVTTSGFCTQAVDLCDPARLPATGWRLVSGGAPDCWWEPNASTATERTLIIPGGGVGPSTTRCYTMFSYTARETEIPPPIPAASSIVLERLEPSGTWTPIFNYPLRGNVRLRTEVIENNAQLSSGLAARMRLRLPAGLDGDGIRVFDAATYCRSGPL